MSTAIDSTTRQDVSHCVPDARAQFRRRNAVFGVDSRHMRVDNRPQNDLRHCLRVIISLTQD
jgi:hypothetical protein